MKKYEPIETDRILPLHTTKDIPKAIEALQKLIFELEFKECFPCDIQLKVIFIRGGCPHA